MNPRFDNIYPGDDPCEDNYAAPMAADPAERMFRLVWSGFPGPGREPEILYAGCNDSATNRMEASSCLWLGLVPGEPLGSVVMSCSALRYAAQT